MKARDQSLDVLRGIGILLMVFDHVGWGGTVHTYIQSFHMPLFFIVSGYLWKKEDVFYLIKKRFMSLMVPYIVFAWLFLILQMIPMLTNSNGFLSSLRAVLIYPTDIDNMPIAPALWFLPCMFLADIVYSLLSQMRWELKIVAIVSIAAIGMLYSSLSDTMLPFTLEPVGTALLFLLIGEIIKKHEQAILKRIDKFWVIAALLIVEAALAMLNGSVDMRSARYNNCGLYLINAVIGTLSYWGISRRVCTPDVKIPRGIQRISSLSRNSMGFICMNQLFIILLDKLIKQFLTNGMIAMLISKVLVFTLVMTIISWITRIIMESRFKFILGRRE